MMIRHIFKCVAMLAAALALVAVFFGARAQPESGEHGLRVVVTVAPLKGLVEPLLPRGSTVTVLMQPGRSEHGYEFTPADMAALAKADVVAYVGLNLEPKIEAALARPSASGRRVVCFAQVVGLEEVEAEGGHDHKMPGHRAPGEEPPAEPAGVPEDQDDHDGHDHGPIDQHLWLDPSLAEKFVTAVAAEVEAVQHARSAGGESARAVAGARDAQVGRLRDMDQKWNEGLKPLRGRAIVTHHNAFGRPAEKYGFRVAAVIRELEGSEPTPGDIALVMEAIKKENVRTIFVEPQFNPAAAERIAKAAGVRVSRLDPLGDGDWFKMMEANLASLVSGLAE